MYDIVWGAVCIKTPAFSDVDQTVTFTDRSFLNINQSPLEKAIHQSLLDIKHQSMLRKI